jgi:FixJ family two-component response regulator
MTEARDKSIFFVGTSGPVDKALNDAVANCGIRAHAFVSADDCRKSLNEGDCDLLVVNLDGDTAQGLDLIAEQEHVLRKMPKIALVDHGDIPTAVRAIKAGADNCLEKPVDAQLLRSEIQILLDQTAPSPSCPMETLTPMEKTVLHLILEGKTNRQIAHTLHRSPRTIEVHRKNIMRKLDASSIVDLVRAAASVRLHQT